jgi:cytochrome bd-type quinol oxidase subunit 2
VAIEFRSKQPMRWWRQMWDVGFSAGSVCPRLLIGVALGNIAWGVPIDANGEFAGTFLGLLKPYPLLVGVTTVALFMMHGAIYGVMKTEGELHDKLRGWAMNCIIFFVICYVMTTMATLLYVPHMTARVRDNPWLFTVALANMLAIANIPREFHHGRDWRGVFVVVRGHHHVDGALRAEHFPEPGLQPAQSGKQPDDLQRRLVAENARHHADHRAASACRWCSPTRLHLLDLPRQGEAGPDELLKGNDPSVTSAAR